MTVFENGQMNAKPLGDNRILGVEISLTYQPRAIKGLSIQTSYTYQNATFTSFKIQTKADPTKDLYGNTIEVVNENVKFLNLEGNRLPEVPLHMFNLLVDYNHRYFGVNFGYNLMSNRYQDVTNILEMPDLTNINAGVHANLKIGSSNARIGIQVKNLTNEQSLVNIGLASDNDTILLRKQGVESLQGSLAQGWIQLPRRAMVYFSYTF
jgi:outer membrane receptor protein involved in Fe transport